MHTVFVSGGTGFIAAHAIRQLLDAGHRVRASVRSLSRPGVEILRGLEGASRRLALVEADLAAPGAFDPHVPGCDVVLHVASPYALDVADPQRDLVDPAVRGTLGILEACARADSVRRVVLTSSMAAITDAPDASRVLTEADWNETSTLERNPYYFSKTLAERAAWEFVRSRAPRWDLVAINPFLVVGPSLTPVLNTSNKVIADLLTGAYPAVLRLAWGLVDVRDVAEAHVRAMDAPQAGGRYICAHEVLSMRELVVLLRRLGFGGYRLPRLSLASPMGDRLVRLASYLQPKGVAQYLRTHVGGVPRFDNSKIQRDLGLRFRPLEQTLSDTVADLVRWGHVPAMPR